MDASLDSWLGRFVVAVNAPPPPSPRTVVSGHFGKDWQQEGEEVVAKVEQHGSKEES